MARGYADFSVVETYHRMSKKTVYRSQQQAEAGFNRAIQAYINRGDEALAQEVSDAGLGAWLESTGRQIENPIIKKEQNMARETQAEKIARLEAEADDARAEAEELRDQRANFLSAVAENYGVKIFDPEDDVEYDEEGEETESDEPDEG